MICLDDLTGRTVPSVALHSITVGRHSYPVVRLGFKPSWGRQTLPGRFDSCCLPPHGPSGPFRHLLPLMSCRSLILKRFMGNGVLAATVDVPHNFLTKYG